MVITVMGAGLPVLVVGLDGADIVLLDPEPPHAAIRARDAMSTRTLRCDL
jgi:hypothetical protein